MTQNIYIKTLIYTGIFVLGVVVFYGFGEYFSKTWGIKPNLATALIVAMFLYPFNLTLIFLAFVSMGLMVLALWGDDKKVFNVEERASTSLISSLGFIGGLILVLVGSYFGATLYISDVKYAQALAGQDMNKTINLLVEAINWNGQDDRYYRASSQVTLSLLSAELNKKNNDAPKPERKKGIGPPAVRGWFRG